MLHSRRGVIFHGLTVSLIIAAFLLSLRLPHFRQPAHAQGTDVGAQAAPVIPGLARLGAQADQYGDVPFATDMERAAGLGAGMIVVQLHWREIEPTRTVTPAYDFAKYDAIFDSAKARGLVPLVVVWDNPAWAYAGDATDRKLLNAEGREGLGQLMKALVQRYGHTKALWSLYSEPDCNGPTIVPGRPVDAIPSTCWGDHGAQYTEMLKVVYPQVKEADSSAPVLLGGMAYDFWGTPTQKGDFSERFLDDVLASGGGAFFDVMNFHYYTEFAEKWAPYGKDIIGKTRYLEAKMAAANLNKPIIISEISRHGRIDSDEATQARYVIQANARAFFAGSSANIWYNLRDHPADPGYGFGLLNGDGSEKPSGLAFKTFSRMFAAFTPVGASQPSVPSGVEAYIFRSSDDRRRLLATWTDAGSKTIRIQTPSVTVTSPTGSTQEVSDAADGQGDGYVTITVTTDPLLVTFDAAAEIVHAQVMLPFVLKGSGATPRQVMLPIILRSHQQ